MESGVEVWETSASSADGFSHAVADVLSRHEGRGGLKTFLEVAVNWPRKVWKERLSCLLSNVSRMLLISCHWLVSHIVEVDLCLEAR